MNLLKNWLMGNKTKSTIENPFPNGTGSFVPVADIKDGLIITEDRRYIKILEVLPVNFHLKSETEQLNMIWYMAGYFKISPVRLQITVRTEPADIDTYCSKLEQLYNAEDNPKCKEMIYEDARLVNYLAETQAVTRRFNLIFSYEGGSTGYEDILKELNEKTETAREFLSYCGLEVVTHDNEDEFLFSTLYSIFRKADANDTDIKSILSCITESGDQEVGMTIKDVLSPDNIDRSHSDYLITDGLYRAYLYVAGYGYPTENDLAWGSGLTELGDGISVSFYLEKMPKERILKKISKTTMFNRVRMKDIEDTRTDFEEMDSAISAGLYLKEKINRDGEDLFYLHTVFEITALDPEALEAKARDVKNKCTAQNLMVRRADYCHEQAFYSMLPLCSMDAELERQTRRNILTYSAAALFPFSSYELCDRQGILLGINQYNNSAVILDNYNSELYSNGNMAIFGMTGAGKTYTILLMAMRLRMQGVQVFIIAPEKGFEYRGACEALGGQYIKLARGSKDCVNIMEIRRKTLDIDENIEGKGLTEIEEIEFRSDSIKKGYYKIRKEKYSIEDPSSGFDVKNLMLDFTENNGMIYEDGVITQVSGNFFITVLNQTMLDAPADIQE